MTRIYIYKYNPQGIVQLINTYLEHIKRDENDHGDHVETLKEIQTSLHELSAEILE